MTPNKNISDIIMNDQQKQNIENFEKIKERYENKLIELLKNTIKDRSALNKLKQKYNEKQTKSIKNKVLDVDEDVETYNEFKENYSGYMYEYFNLMFEIWNVNQIKTFIKKQNYNKVKNEIEKVTEKIKKLRDKLPMSDFIEQSVNLYKDLEEWKNLLQTRKNLITEFETEFNKLYTVELEEKLKITKEARKKSLIKAREVKKKTHKKEKLKEFTVSVLLYAKLSDEDLVEFHDLKLNNHEKFKKIYHGYVIGKDKTRREREKFIKEYGEEIISKNIRSLLDQNNHVIHNIKDIHIKYQKNPPKITIKADNKFNRIDFENKRIYEDDVELFKYSINILKTNEDMKTFINMVCESAGISLLIFRDILENVNLIGTDPIETSYHNSISNEKIFLKYVDYDVNLKSETFKDLFITKDNYDDYKENSCFLNLIMSTYRDKIKGRYYKQLTFENLCEILKIQNLNQNIGLTVKQSVEFFKKYKLGFFLIDRNYDVVFKFQPSTYTTRISPRTLYCVFDNHHIYKCNDDINSLSQKIHNKIQQRLTEEKYEQPEQIFTNYAMRNFDAEESCKTVFIENLNDICTYVKTNCKNKKTKNVRFCASNLNLHHILFYMVNECRYIPSIQMKGNEMKKLYIKIKKDIYPIMTDADDNNENNLEVHIDNEKDYFNYYNCDKEIYLWFINPMNMSYTNDNLFNIEEEYSIGPLSGHFDLDFDTNIYIGIDHIKAYSSCLLDVRYFPVFNVFDHWLPFENQPINDYTQYIIELNNNDLQRLDVQILFTQKFTRCYGYKLNKINNIQYKIHLYRKPSKLIKTNSPDYLKKLYNNPTINIKNKKFIVNKNTGLLEKKYNSANKAGIFKNMDDAHYYKNKYGGHIHFLRDCDENEIENYHELNDDFDKLYLHKVSNKKHLNEVFRPIKDLIYEIQTVKNYELYKKLHESNIKIKGIRTDAFLIHEEDIHKLENINFINEKEYANDNQFCTLGKYKLESNKTLTNRRIMVEVNNLNLNMFTMEKVNVIQLNNEYDENELINKTQNSNRVIIKGNFPGVGKTYSAMQITKSKRVLFVALQNKLCQKIKRDGFECITFHKLFGLSIYQRVEKKRKLYKITDYEYIVFDELMQYDILQLQMIHRFITKHENNIKIVSTGDYEQLLPFTNTQYNNVTSLNKYIDNIINVLFPNQITLNIIKRLENEIDKCKIINMKKDIFNMSLNVIDIFTKYNIKIIDEFDDLKTVKNISYFKNRAYDINNYVHKNLVNPPFDAVEIAGIKYWPGLEIVCKEYFMTKNMSIHVNYAYNIVEINVDENYFIIKDENEDEDYMIEIYKYNRKDEEINILNKYFKLPYCSTCHSAQGDTITEKITIFDCNSPYVDRNYIWTALTRVKYLENITIFKHSDDEIKSLNYCKLLQYFKIKIAGYKNQDKIAKRNYNENDYINHDELWNNYKNQKLCTYCKEPLHIFLNNKNVINSNITIDRKDNTLPHVKNNCVLCCLHCNVSKH